MKTKIPLKTFISLVSTFGIFIFVLVSRYSVIVMTSTSHLLDPVSAEASLEHLNGISLSTDYRLPTSIRPFRYVIKLKPDLLEKYTFAGDVLIELRVINSTSTIVLNSAELDFHYISVEQESKQFTVIKHSFDEKNERCTIELNGSLESGKNATLHIKYTGTLNDDMRGFYRAKYTSSSGEEKYMAVSQFEATDARRCFPCWDEPAVKATYKAYVTAPKQLTVVSNGAELSAKADSDNPDNTVHEFEETQILSTYLVAFVVGEFDYLEDISEDKKTPLRIFTPVGKSKQGQFAMDFTKRVLSFYNDWFGIHYPFGKLDQLAIPSFAAGAMENAGCVTYRETVLLYDEEHSSAQTKQNIALTVAHEISHQWFGNMVTMQWWSELYLNEGFATWMENYATDHLFPDWNIWSQYTYNDFNEALSLDALESSHPIEVPIYHASEVDEVFDAVSYSKGSVVIRMAENFIGSENLKRGLQVYIKKFSFKNANSNDLWTTLAEVSGKPVDKMMQAWTKQTGFPLLNIQTNDQTNLTSTTPTYEIEQNRFLSNGMDYTKDSTWIVPLSVLADGHDELIHLEQLNTKREKRTVQLKKAAKWIKFNANQINLYRVAYPEPLLNSLIAAIQNNDTKLTIADRLGIENDAFALSRAGVIPTVRLLNLLNAYVNETSFEVWADIITNLNGLGDILKSDETVYKLFSKFVVSLLQNVINYVKWDKAENESHTMSLLRSRVLSAAARYGDNATIIEANKRFLQYYTQLAISQNSNGTVAMNESLLIPDLRAAVYSTVVSSGGQLAYQCIRQMIKWATLAEERVRLLRSLASTNSTELLNETIEYAMSDQVRSQDAPSMLVLIGSNRFGTELLWNFYKNNWQRVLDKFGNSGSIRYIVSIISEYSDEQRKQEFIDFFTNHQIPNAERSYKQSLETLISNSKWSKRDKQNIQQWLQQNIK